MFMRRTQMLAGLATLPFSTVLAARAANAATSTATWRGGYQSALSSLEGVWMNTFGDALEKGTQGRIKLLGFPSGQLGDPGTQLRQVQQGGLNLALINTDVPGSLSPEFTVFSTPFLFPSLGAADAVLAGPVGADYLKEFDRYGLTGITVQSHALRDFQSNKPIHTVADMKGLKIRTQGSEMINKMYEALGAIPIAVAPSEVTTALKTGTVMAADNVSWSTYAQKIYEAAKYDIELGAIAGSFVVVVNQKDFQNLTPQDQQAVRSAAHVADLALQQKRNAAIADALAGFKAAGLTVTMPEQLDSAGFRAAILKGMPKVDDPGYQKLYTATQAYITSHKLK